VKLLRVMFTTDPLRGVRSWPWRKNLLAIVGVYFAIYQLNAHGFGW